MALYVRESGSADKPTIVWLHGGGASGWTWEKQVNALTEYHHLVPDLPEHGQSIAEKPFTIMDSTARIAALIRDRAHHGRAHVVGLSLGAQIAVQLFAAAPERVDHAIVTGTLVHPIPGAGMVGLMMKLYAPFKNMPFMVRANMRSYAVPDEYYEPFSRDTRLLTTDGFAHIITENMSFHLPDGLQPVNSPVLVAVGEKEQRAMRQSARDLAAALPNARAIIAPHVGHNWGLQAPDLFIRMVRAWMSDQPLPNEFLPIA